MRKRKYFMASLHCVLQPDERPHPAPAPPPPPPGQGHVDRMNESTTSVMRCDADSQRPLARHLCERPGQRAVLPGCRFVRRRELAASTQAGSY